jgi:hypothetical protein
MFLYCLAYLLPLYGILILGVYEIDRAQVLVKNTSTKRLKMYVGLCRKNRPDSILTLTPMCKKIMTAE